MPFSITKSDDCEESDTFNTNEIPINNLLLSLPVSYDDTHTLNLPQSLTIDSDEDSDSSGDSVKYELERARSSFFNDVTNMSHKSGSLSVTNSYSPNIVTINYDPNTTSTSISVTPSIASHTSATSPLPEKSGRINFYDIPKDLDDDFDRLSLRTKREYGDSLHPFPFPRLSRPNSVNTTGESNPTLRPQFSRINSNAGENTTVRIGDSLGCKWRSSADLLYNPQYNQSNTPSPNASLDDVSYCRSIASTPISFEIPDSP